MSSNSIDTALFSTLRLDSDSAYLKACIGCFCKKWENCSETKCTDTGACRPYPLTLEFWKDAGRLRAEYETSANETQAFWNCVNDIACATEAVSRYAKRFKLACQINGTFSCQSVTNMLALGPTGCKDSMQRESLGRIENIELCFNENILKQSSRIGNAGLIAGLVVGGIIALVGLILAIFIIKRRKSIMEGEIGTTFRILRNSVGNKFDENEINLPLELIIPPDELKIDASEPLGEGQYGIVYKGYYNYKKIAVKKPKLGGGPNSNAISEFSKELELLASVGFHKNIVRFYGAEISQIRRDIAYVVLEFSPYGNLVDHMRTHHTYLERKNDSESSSGESYQSVKPSEKLADPSAYSTRIHWVEQIAGGMDFLEQSSVLHGDLAARNVLLFTNNKVKISDFGCARNLKNYNEYEKKEGPLPWRWMAPESLERRIFSAKSDVWSFGVTVWEIFTAGIIPYIGEEKLTKEFTVRIKDGQRLPQPTSAPDEIHEIMLKCWDLDPEARPTFATLFRYFHIERMSVCGTFLEDDYEQIIGEEVQSST